MGLHLEDIVQEFATVAEGPGTELHAQVDQRFTDLTSWLLDVLPFSAEQQEAVADTVKLAQNLHRAVSNLHATDLPGSLVPGESAGAPEGSPSPTGSDAPAAPVEPPAPESAPAEASQTPSAAGEVSGESVPGAPTSPPTPVDPPAAPAGPVVAPAPTPDAAPAADPAATAAATPEAQS